MYYIGLDVHKKTISYCVKDVAGCVHGEGKIGSTRRELDGWVRTHPNKSYSSLQASDRSCATWCRFGEMSGSL
jgi:hypothetical protein